MKFLDKHGLGILWDKINELLTNYKNTAGFKSGVESVLDEKLGDASGLAGLDENGKLKTDQLPNFKTVNNQSIVGTGNISIDLTLFQLVQNLPTENINTNKVYLLLTSNPHEGDRYTEHVYVNGEWEQLGEYRTELNLVTPDANGIMSKEDKVKLNGIAENATKDEAITEEELNALLV